MDPRSLLEHFQKVHAAIRQVVGAMPDHGAFLAQVTGAART
jgi:hypothetical protein